MLDKTREEFCPKCDAKVQATLTWRDNGEGEYSCTNCDLVVMRIRRRDHIVIA